MNKIFKPLSAFKNRDVELFRSIDPNNTAIYFTDVPSEKRSSAKAYFELLRFGYESGENSLVYIKYPNTNYFIECHDFASGSSRGNMVSNSGQNIWESYKSELKIHSHDDNLVLLIGKYVTEFNFMKRVASYNKGNRFSKPYPNESFNNYSEIEKALECKYLELPMNIRTISYSYKLKGTEKYILVDYPAYKFHYTNQRFFLIEENNIPKQLDIINFERYRDGGTTYITVIDSEGNSHLMYSPTSFNKGKIATYDELELIETTEEEKQMLLVLLNIKEKKQENEE